MRPGTLIDTAPAATIIVLRDVDSNEYYCGSIGFNPSLDLAYRFTTKRRAKRIAINQAALTGVKRNLEFMTTVIPASRFQREKVFKHDVR